MTDGRIIKKNCAVIPKDWVEGWSLVWENKGRPRDVGRVQLRVVGKKGRV